jgi:molybdopterin-containing oxidoreductase family membrane subunit
MPGVLGAFEHIDAATDAIHALKARGHTDLTVYSAAPNHELEEAIGHSASGVRLFTLIGGLIGCTAGFAMTIWMAYDWPVLVGGKPIGAIPPYVVLAFELTILFGSLFTVAGVIILSMLRSLKGRPYHPRFSDDRIGIFVPCGPQDAGSVVRLMTEAGSVEVRHEAA